MKDKAWFFPLLVAVVALVFGAAGYFASQWFFQPEPEDASTIVAPDGPSVATELIASTIPTFTLTDLAGVPQNSEQWLGKVVLINFWATWCPPCLEEMPGFVELQERYGPRGFQAVGIAIDEKEAVKAMSDSLGVNYPVLIGENEAISLSSRLGNHFGALPYSVVVDRKGRVQFIRPGALHKEELEKQLLKLL
jgi:thiol-disulfide isomerase/thioredoxin